MQRKVVVAWTTVTKTIETNLNTQQTNISDKTWESFSRYHVIRFFFSIAASNTIISTQSHVISWCLRRTQHSICLLFALHRITEFFFALHRTPKINTTKCITRKKKLHMQMWMILVLPWSTWEFCAIDMYINELDELKTAQWRCCSWAFSAINFYCDNTFLLSHRINSTSSLVIGQHLLNRQCSTRHFFFCSSCIEPFCLWPANFIIYIAQFFFLLARFRSFRCLIL